jgi:hypothetical protein
MKTAIQLRERLSNVFDNLESGDMKAQVAKELNNTAGKIIASVKLELEYFALRKEPPDIPFIRVLPPQNKRARPAA